VYLHARRVRVIAQKSQQGAVEDSERKSKNLPVVSSVVSAHDMPKRTLPRLIFTTFDKRDLLPQFVPELSVIRVHVQTVVMHKEIKVCEE
jgi:hypothetical protein